MLLSVLNLNMAKNIKFSFRKTSSKGGENEYLSLYFGKHEQSNTTTISNENGEDMKGSNDYGWMDGNGRKYMIHKTIWGKLMVVFFLLLLLIQNPSMFQGNKDKKSMLT